MQSRTDRGRPAGDIAAERGSRAKSGVVPQLTGWGILRTQRTARTASAVRGHVRPGDSQWRNGRRNGRKGKQPDASTPRGATGHGAGSGREVGGGLEGLVDFGKTWWKSKGVRRMGVVHALEEVQHRVPSEVREAHGCPAHRSLHMKRSTRRLRG